MPRPCTQDKKGYTPLAFAALSGDLRSIKLLLEYVPKVMQCAEIADFRYRFCTV